MLNRLIRDLRKQADPEKAKILQKFCKTGPGEYGGGDRFIGVVVPEIRVLVKRYGLLGIKDAKTLLRSPVHEERLTALLILVARFENGDEEDREKIYRAYLENTKFINSWDLVDLSSERIVGAFLRGRNKAVLYKLAGSKDLWERRIAIIATFDYIKEGRHEHTFAIAEILVDDEHDLIHKAVGWMLREVGKRIDLKTEERFLKKHSKHMPRTMLRYAIERFPEKKRQAYLRRA